MRVKWVGQPGICLGVYRDPGSEHEFDDATAAQLIAQGRVEPIETTPPPPPPPPTKARPLAGGTDDEE